MADRGDRPVVFVVDDDEGVRKALSLLIRSAGFEVRTFDSSEAFLEDYSPDAAGCLVLDVRMTGMDGMSLQEELWNRGLDIPVIMMTGHGDVPMAVKAVQRGAIDFLQKPFEDEVLLERIRQALALNAQRRVEAGERALWAARLARLSAREREVMDLLVSGLGNKEIALKLGLSRKTVDIHRAHVMLKLGVESVAELVRIGLLHGSGPGGG